MARRVITAADVQSAAAAGAATLPVDDTAIVTALARDEAARLGLSLCTTTAGATPPAGLEQRVRELVTTALGERGARVRPALVHIPGQSVQMEPFAVDIGRPEMDVRTTDVITDADGSPMAAGFMTLREGSFPWSLTYDEVEYVIEGELHIGTEQGTLVGRPGDVLFVPKGSDITFGTPSWARFLYVTHPAQWSSPEGGSDQVPGAGPAGTAVGTPAGAGPPSWDVPTVFPVDPVTAAVCTTCEEPITHKPSHLTQIDATHFGPKTHPRIRLRGLLDSLHAQALLVAGRATADGQPVLAAHLGTLAAYCRELTSAEYADRAAAPITLPGVDEGELHAATHDPQGAMGVPHVLPGPGDAELLHWLGWLRCAVREAELVALEAFPPESATPQRASVWHGLNRLSSAVYYLQLLHQRAATSAGGGR